MIALNQFVIVLICYIHIVMMEYVIYLIAKVVIHLMFSDGCDDNYLCLDFSVTNECPILLFM